MIGKIVQIEPSQVNKAFVVIETNASNLASLEGWINKEAEINIKKPFKARSLDANAYFHVLARKIAEHDGISETHAKNILVGLYGEPEYIGDIKATIKTNLTPEIVCEIEEPHFKFIKCDEQGIYWYYVYRGTRTYSKEEMGKLIDGTVIIAESKGIETIPPDEIKHLLEVWENEKK